MKRYSMNLKTEKLWKAMNFCFLLKILVKMLVKIQLKT